jgi:Fe-S cluster assembly protein SufD
MSARRREIMTMTAATPLRTPAERDLIELFAHAPNAHPVRLTAARAFEANGLPHRRVEEYKYTDLRALIRAVPPRASAPAADVVAEHATTALPESLGVKRIVFVDGVLQPQVSDALGLDGLTVRPLADALDQVGALHPQKADPIVGLNTAGLGAGVVIEIADGAVVDAPIEIAHIVAAPSPVSVYLRHVVHVGVGARVTFLETYRGPAAVAYQVNTAIELAVGEGAEVTLVKLQQEGDQALHLGTLMTTLAASARLDHFQFVGGALTTRGQVFATYAGEEVTFATRGIALLRGKQHADATLVVDHAVPHGKSRELYKAVIDDAAKSVFQGKIIVRPHAQKTDGQMSSNAVLLSDDAEVANKPELEIFADDVVCAHGATTGSLDEKLKFYLKSRGIPDREAEKLLVIAFLAEAVEEMERPEIGDVLIGLIEAWLDARG